MSAVLDETRTYRYLLHRPSRSVAGTPPTLWVMVNPSTADESTDDPTIRKILGFTRLWAAAQRRQRGSLYVVNLFGLRATDPRELQRHPDPVGPDNEVQVYRAAQLILQLQGRIVVAWGAHRFARSQARSVSKLLLGRCTSELWCLGTTKDGSPRHPLYVPYSQPLVPWEGYR